MKNIILFGPAGAGKTTAAMMIIDFASKKGIHAVRLSQGDKIKKICAELKYSTDKEDRELQQIIGQEMRRIFGIDVWCNYLKNKINSFYTTYFLKPDAIIIDDGRQVNEFNFWGEQEFIQVGIIADLETRIRRLLDRDGYDQRDRLQFENEITADYIAREKCWDIIRNEGTMDELRVNVRALLDAVIGEDQKECERENDGNGCDN